MGSTHPPLESLLTFSQNCLEGFEHSRLNRISHLRKEIHEVVEEWIESEIDARLARWVLEGRQASEADSLSDQAARAEFFPPEFALRNRAHGAGELVSPSDELLPPEFPCDPIPELHVGDTLELQPPFRRAPVSQDASAALRSLEHSARCKVRSIGDHSMNLLNCHDPDSAQECVTLPFSVRDGLQAPSNVASPISDNPSSTNQREPYFVRYASAVPASGRSRGLLPSGLNLRPQSRRSTAYSLGRYTFVIGSGGRDLRALPPIRVSLRQFSLRRAAVFLRN